MNRIKPLLLALALLNVLDMLLTAVGLLRGYFIEKNEWMNFLWESNPMYFFAVKFILSLLLIFVISFKRQLTSPIVYYSTCIAVGLYLGVLALHGVVLFYI